MPKHGSLDPSSSIFGDEVDGAASDKEGRQAERDPAIMAAVLDPQPHNRKRWQRKMLIRSIQHRHRMTKKVKIARSERESLSKSDFFKTSIKKLGPLARQIAGKPIDDAIVQMRFSKKKAAKIVLKHLEQARDEAVVRRGMGLGGVKAEDEAVAMESIEGPIDDLKQNEVGKKEERILVEDKKGKKRWVNDRSAMYVDQAWVGRGRYGRELEYRARGRVNILRPPHTSKSPARHGLPLQWL